MHMVIVNQAALLVRHVGMVLQTTSLIVIPGVERMERVTMAVRLCLHVRQAQA